MMKSLYKKLAIGMVAVGAMSGIGMGTGATVAHASTAPTTQTVTHTVYVEGQTKVVTQTQTNTTGVFPSTISYNQDGFTGTLNQTGITKVQVGTHNETHTEQTKVAVYRTVTGTTTDSNGVTHKYTHQVFDHWNYVTRNVTVVVPDYQYTATYSGTVRQPGHYVTYTSTVAK